MSNPSHSDGAHERSLFIRALEMSDGGERAAFLDQACGDDQDLRARLDDLLVRFADTEFLQQPAVEAGETRGDQANQGSFLEEPGARIGDYKLLQQIGEGGMGVVYMAEQHHPVERKVALKIIKLGMDTRQIVARFEAERQALAMMDHPNIARVFDAGATESGRPYFVMELVQGLPITEFCDRNKLSTEERLRLLMLVCQAIQSAHQKGVIHRDIKPSNILVTMDYGEPTPKVIDFGIAKALHQKLTEKTLFTQHGQMVGTPAYMSPEQAEMCNLDVDARTDVYSLGVLLYELLTGTLPFSSQELMGAGHREMQRIIAEDEPAKPSTRMSTMEGELRSTVAKNRGSDPGSIGRQCLGDLDWITMKCLEKDRRRRYGTPNELLADIQRHLNSEPISAVAPSIFYILSKFHQKHKVVVRSAIAIAVVLIVATVVSATLAIWNNELRKDAEAAQAVAVERSVELEDNAYVSDMLAVEAAVDKKEFARAEQLLGQHRREPSGRDLRGFAWRFYADRVRGDWLDAIQAHDGSTNRMVRGAVNQSEIGRIHVFRKSPRFLTAGADGTIRLWGGANRELLQEWQCAGVFKVSPNEQYLCFTDSDGQVSLWDLSANRLIRRSRVEGRKHVRFKFTHDSRWVVIRDTVPRAPLAKGRVYVEDVLSGNVVFVPEGYWFDFAVSPSEPILLTTGFVETKGDLSSRKDIVGDSQGYLWDLKRGELIDSPLDAHGVYGMGVHFSPSGDTIVMSHSEDPGDINSDQGARVFRAASGELVSTIEEIDLGGGSPYISEQTVSFSNDENYIAALPTMGSRKTGVWSLQTGERLALNSDYLSSVRSLSFHPESDELLISVSQDRGMHLWNWKQDRIVRRYSGAKSDIYALGIDPIGASMVTGGLDGQLQFWPLHRVSPTNQLPQWMGHYSAPVFSRHGRYLVLSEPAEVRQPTRQVKYVPVSGMRRPAVKRVVFATANSKRLWEVAQAEKVLGFSADERTLLTVSIDELHSRDAETGALVSSVALDSPVSQHQILSPEGTIFLSFLEDGRFSVIEVETGRTLREFDEVCGPDSVCFGSSGKKIVFGTQEGARAGVWDHEKDKVDWLEHVGQDTNIGRLRITPDERFVAATTSERRRMTNARSRVWELPSGRHVRTIESNVIDELFFTADSRSLVIRYSHRKSDSRFMVTGLKLFDLRTFRQVADLKPPLNSSWVSQGIQSPDGRLLLSKQHYGSRRIELVSVPSLEQIESW